MSQLSATLQYFRASKGLKLYYHKWLPEEPKAMIVFLHGLGDHVGRYGSFTRYFATRGYGVSLFDLRGHGKSGGRRTHVNRFNDYLYDISQFIEFVKDPSGSVPIFLVGHSFGGQLALNFIVRYSKGIRGVVALSPNIRPKLDVPAWKMKLGRMGARYFPILRIKHEVDPAILSHDLEVQESIRHDKNIFRDVTLRCGREILDNVELVMAMASRIHLPILMMHGGADKICDPEATKQFFMRVPVYNKRLKIYPGLYHELLNEKDKRMVFADIEGWLEEQLGVEYRLAGSGGRKGGVYG